MTENEWLRSTDPEPMLVYLEAPRKEQLICVACLRRIEHLLTDDGCRGAIAAIERNVDAPMEYDEFMTAYYAAYGGWDRMASVAFDGNYATPLLRAMSDAGLAAWHAIDGDYQCIGGVANAVACFAAPANTEEWIAARQIESAAQADIIREIVGNPFYSIAFDPTWRTTETVLLARRAYESRDFSSMPQLATALASAGCTDAAILQHCQQSATHFRGCWVVDLVLDMKWQNPYRL